MRDVRIGSVTVAREVVTPGRRQRRQAARADDARVPCLSPYLRSMLFAEGQNVKQVQRWLGHAKAPITLDTYPHLLDEGVGETLGSFLWLRSRRLPREAVRQFPRWRDVPRWRPEGCSPRSALPG